ncbi:uncharacterized protein LOC132698555 [Cylas formicarius]|uniref:uncharacterized protein LOC132698555 n=1 Tax=Cylas formicarius TaxID=197179 RepID=UPI0029588FF2|nr:uncharacterized protein LOC132698555 [Cylas formicarius]
MNESEIREKINDYEKFVQEKLKKDLKDIEALLLNKSQEHKDWKEAQIVARNLQEFKDKDRDMNVMFDMGHNIMCSGEISNCETIYVDIGLNNLLEMNCEELDKYADIRLKLLSKEIEHFRKLAVNVKVHIKMVLLAINELQSTLKVAS